MLAEITLMKKRPKKFKSNSAGVITILLTHVI